MIKVGVVLLATLFFLLKTSPAFADSLVLNELMAHPSLGDDWIEIYNPTASSVDLNNWTLVDSTSSMKTLTGSISAGGFVTFDVSNRLNNGGDTVYLKDTSAVTIDSYTYSTDPGLDKSLGRSPDGGSWATLTTSSKGSANGGTSSSAPTPTPTSSPSTSSSFTISGVPSSIDSTQTFSVAVNLNLSDNPNTKFYLKGAFKRVDSANYFGLTKVGSSWIKNGASYSDQLSLTTDSTGKWSGSLEIQPDIMDSGYEGSGDYIFKVGRYTSTGSGPSWSNEVTIKLNAKPVQDDHSEPVNLSKIKTPASQKTNQGSTTNQSLPEVYSLEKYRKQASPSATPLAPPTQQPEVKGVTSINPLIFVGGFLLVGGITIIVYIRFKSRYNADE